MSNAKFSLGQVVITRNALDVLHPEDVKTCLALHANGEWGDLGESDRRTNEIGLAQGVEIVFGLQRPIRVPLWDHHRGGSVSNHHLASRRLLTVCFCCSACHQFITI